MDQFKAMYKRCAAYELFGIKKKKEKHESIMAKTTPEERKKIAASVMSASKECFNKLSAEQKRGLKIYSDKIASDDFINGDYDVIAVVHYDTWDYAKAIHYPNARELGDLDEPMWKAMDDYMNLLHARLEKLSLPHIKFIINNDGGDWDSGTVDVTVKYVS